MRLDRDTHTRLLKLLGGPRDEIDARYTGTLTPENFDKLVQYCSAHGRDFRQTNENKDLKV